MAKYKRNYLKDFIKQLGRSKIVIFIVSWAAYFAMRLLYKSMTIKINNLDKAKKQLKKGPVFMLFWHGRSLISAPFWVENFDKSHKASAIFSTSRDGNLMEAIMTKFRLSAIKGSSNKNSKEAAFQIVRNLKNNTTVALTIDGPTGPRHVIRALSPFYFSSKFQVPIIIFSWSANRGKFLNVWDRYFIPYPFSKATINLSDPFTVPKNATDKDIEKIAMQFEKQMLQSLHDTDALYGHPAIPAQPRNLTKKRKDI